MTLAQFFDAYVQALGYLIYIVIALAFVSAYYDWKNENDVKKECGS